MAVPSHVLSPVYTVHMTAEIETGMAEKSSWDQTNRRKKLGLVWKIRKKISQIIKDYFYLPFFLLIILWREVNFKYEYLLEYVEKIKKNPLSVKVQC